MKQLNRRSAILMGLSTQVVAAQRSSEGAKKIQDVLDDIDRNQRSGSMIVPREDGKLLRVLAETAGAKTVFELGTSVGYSGLHFCLALRSTGGHLTTFDIDPGRQGSAKSNIEKAGASSLVTFVLGDAHIEAPKRAKTIDLLFIDADKEGYLDYLNKLAPAVRPGGLIVAHNMHSPSPDPRFVEAIKTRPDLSTAFVNMDAAGLSVSVKLRS